MKLKKGIYYIGDPCYIFNKSWDDLLESNDYFNKEGVINIFNNECVISNTDYGDGIYFDNSGRKYAVDSGLIGILPIELIDKDKVVTFDEVENSIYMHMYAYAEDFEVDVFEGVFYFGNVIIDTNMDEDEEY